MQSDRVFPIISVVNVRSKNSVNLLCKISKNTNALPVGVCYPDVNAGGKKGNASEEMHIVEKQDTGGN